MRKIRWTLVFVVMVCIFAVACSNNESKETHSFDSKEGIVALQREAGSGTRARFLDFLDIAEKDMPNVPDNVVSGTDVMITAIENTPYSIGYVSFNKLTASVKVLSIDGQYPTAEGIQDNSYPFVRGLYLVTKEDRTELMKDFLEFALYSDKIEEQGFVPYKTARTYVSNQPSGKLKITGSSSVYPLLSDIIADYRKENPNAEIEINQTDSSNGIKSVADGIADIAMTSRKLTKDEMVNKKVNLIAKDAIAVIVNKENPINDITIDKLKDIYILKIKTWED